MCFMYFKLQIVSIMLDVGVSNVMLVYSSSLAAMVEGLTICLRYSIVTFYVIAVDMAM